MPAPVALRGRGTFATLFTSILRRARRQQGWREPDRRNLRTWKHMLLGVIVTRSTRLLRLAQTLVGRRRATRVKHIACGLGDFLRHARLPIRPLSTRLLEAALHDVDPTRLETYQGLALLVLDPTEYPKRSRSRGKQGRHMQHIGQVRTVTRQGTRRPGSIRRRTGPASGAAAGRPSEPPTTTGYVDIWAGLVLRGKQFLPVARQLYSSAHPHLPSQNRVEEAVLAQALALCKRVGLAMLVLADRGLGRKALLIRLACAQQPFVIRIDADILVSAADTTDTGLLTDLLAAQAPWGTAVWERRDAPSLLCNVRVVRAAIRYSRSGRVADYTEATLTFVELRPLDGRTEPLVLATTLGVPSVVEARAVARLYGLRWAVESGLETMKAWGLGRFMVRGWEAIDRLLWVVALAYALGVLALQHRRLQRLREQAVQVLQEQAVLGKELTVGKLGEAIALDFGRHRRAWFTAWLPG